MLAGHWAMDLSTLPVPVVLPFQPLQSAATVAAAALFPAFTWLTLVVWVYQDARARGSDRPVLAAAGVALVPPALVVYVYHRPERTQFQSDAERLTLSVLLALLSAMMAGTVFSPPDVFAQPRNTFGALLFMLPLFYLIVYRQPQEPDAESEDD